MADPLFDHGSSLVLEVLGRVFLVLEVAKLVELLQNHTGSVAHCRHLQQVLHHDDQDQEPQLQATVKFCYVEDVLRVTCSHDLRRERGDQGYLVRCVA